MTATQKPNGVLYHRQGIRILRVWGTPEEMGYAHGYLLAPEIIDGVSELVGLGGKQYEKVLRACQKRLVAPAWAKQEAAGILDGLRAALSAKKRIIRGLKREITLLDLWAVNTYSEWNGLGCSSASAWGTMTQTGHTLLARNLDYMPFKTCTSNHVAIARNPKGGTKWVSFAWPGALGCYSGFSGKGVAAMVHDAWACTNKRNRKYVSRQITFQALLQDLDNGSRFTSNAADLLRRYPTIRGSSLHVAGRKGTCVLEYDDDRTHDEGVTRRLPDVGQHWMACTNSFQAREKQGDCMRMTLLSTAMQELDQYTSAVDPNDRLDMQDMWDLIGEVGNAITLQTLVIDTSSLEVMVGLADRNCPAHEKKPVKLAWRDFWTAKDDGTKPTVRRPKGESWLRRTLGGGVSGSLRDLVGPLEEGREVHRELLQGTPAPKGAATRTPASVPSIYHDDFAESANPSPRQDEQWRDDGWDEYAEFLDRQREDE